jgi:plastocyanin
MRMLRLPLLLHFALAAHACGQAGGTVTGTVPLPPAPAGKVAVEKYTGAISGKVARPPAPVAGVWLEGPGTKAAKNPVKVVIEQRGYQFGHSLLIIAPGTTVEFPNHDPDYHNIFSLSRTKRFDIGRYKRDETPAPSVTFDQPGFVRLKCEIHDHMNASVLIADSRFRALTDTAGKFTLTGVPPGQYTLRARLDEKRHWTASITVSDGKTVTATLVPSSALP